jgi:hypothetical protein
MFGATLEWRIELPTGLGTGPHEVNMHSIRATPFAWRATGIPSAVLFALVLGACQDPPVGPGSSGIALAPPLLSESRADRAFTFTTIEYPGATLTQAWGINARGDIVGHYVLNGTHGFVLRDGVFTTIDYPLSVLTEVRGIGPDGDIVGTYRLPGQTGQIHGFVRSNDGEYRRVDSPTEQDRLNTIAQRILPDGTILGCHHGADMMGSMEGIMLSREGFSKLVMHASMHNGATPDRRHIVGLYMNMVDGVSRQEGYRIDDGLFTALVVPESKFTAAWDINPAGDIVGVYQSQDDKLHGFLLREGTYTTIDFPSAPGATVTATRAFGVNARGDVVGNYVLGGKTYGYVARR